MYRQTLWQSQRISGGRLWLHIIYSVIKTTTVSQELFLITELEYSSVFQLFCFSAEFNTHSLLHGVSDQLFAVTLSKFGRDLPDTGWKLQLENFQSPCIRDYLLLICTSNSSNTSRGVHMSKVKGELTFLFLLLKHPGKWQIPVRVFPPSHLLMPHKSFTTHNFQEKL